VALPEFVWLKIIGEAASDDFGMASDLRLIVSDRALAHLQEAGIANAVVTPIYWSGRSPWQVSATQPLAPLRGWCRLKARLPSNWIGTSAARFGECYPTGTPRRPSSLPGKPHAQA
jgi:hypothetical protein